MNTNNNTSGLEIINVLEDSYSLWQYCKENDFTSEDFETWYNNGSELAFFEGDPDIIKINGETGYFCKCGNKVFYYFDDCQSNTSWKTLKDFYSDIKTGITLGCNSYMTGRLPEGFEAIEGKWNEFEKLENAIAWRGGAGYFYSFWNIEKYIKDMEETYNN